MSWIDEVADASWNAFWSKPGRLKPGEVPPSRGASVEDAKDSLSLLDPDEIMRDLQEAREQHGPHRLDTALDIFKGMEIYPKKCESWETWFDEINLAAAEAIAQKRHIGGPYPMLWFMARELWHWLALEKRSLEYDVLAAAVRQAWDEIYQVKVFCGSKFDEFIAAMVTGKTYGVNVRIPEGAPQQLIGANNKKNAALLMQMLSGLAGAIAGEKVSPHLLIAGTLAVVLEWLDYVETEEVGK